MNPLFASGFSIGQGLAPWGKSFRFSQWKFRAEKRDFPWMRVHGFPFPRFLEGLRP